MFNLKAALLKSYPMQIQFSLRKQGNSVPVIIIQVFDARLEGRKFMFSTGVKIPTTDWDKSRSRAKPIFAKAKEYSKLNALLDSLETALMSFRAEKLLAQKLTRKELKSLLQGLVGRKEEQQPDPENPLFKCWEQIIREAKNSSGTYISPATRKAKLQTLALVKTYSRDKVLITSFKDIDMAFYKAFDQFMVDRGLSANSRGKHFKDIKAIMREAIDRDYDVNMAFQKKSFKVIRTEPESVFLNDDEIRNLIRVKLPTRLEILRDIFVMACFVGARHSDWHQIIEPNIFTVKGKQILRIRQQKTNDTTHVPVHPVVRAILNKYGDRLPRIISNQKFNEALKEICKEAELGVVSINNKVVPKWQKVSTHTARRSFATNAYLSRSMDVYQIMKCTGHKTEASFLRYLKLNGKDFAIQAADSSFFTNTSFSMGLAS